MQVRSIPNYIDTRSLTITRQAMVDGNPRITEIAAADPQGDSFVIRREQEDTGALCVVPDVELTVSYQPANQEPEKPRAIGGDEAGDLYFALRDAKQGENLDPMAGMWILSDLRSQGGVGGAC